MKFIIKKLLEKSLKLTLAPSQRCGEKAYYVGAVCVTCDLQYIQGDSSKMGQTLRLKA